MKKLIYFFTGCLVLAAVAWCYERNSNEGPGLSPEQILNDTIILREAEVPQLDHGCPLGWQYHNVPGIPDTCFDSDSSWMAAKIRRDSL